MAVLEPGAGNAIQEAMGPWLDEQGFTLEIVQATSYDNFVELMEMPTTHLGVVPSEDLMKTYLSGLSMNLDGLYPAFEQSGVTYRRCADVLTGTVLARIDSMCVVRNGFAPTPDLQSFLTVCTWLFTGCCAPNDPAKPNSFDFTIVPPASSSPEGTPPKPTMSAKAIDCDAQTITLTYSGENYEVLHVLWNKQPPAGSGAVPRTANDNEGDKPDDKTPSTATMKDPKTGQASWSVPFCSNGTYTVKVWVTWKCIPTGVVDVKYHELEIVRKA